LSAAAKVPKAGPFLPPGRGTSLSFIAVFCFAFVAATSFAVFPFAQTAGRLTVQIMPDGNASLANEASAAIAVLNATPGIASASVLSDAENLELVAPWLGRDVAPGTLPFPVLIDVRLARGSSPDVAALQRRLVASAPHAVLDADRQRVPGGASVPEAGTWLAALLPGICSLALAVSIALLLRMRIAANRETLRLLHLFGASKSRIARLLTLPLTVGVLLASAAGTALAGGLFLLPGTGFGHGAAMAELPNGGLPWLAIIPVTAALIAWLTGWFLVTSELRRL
jgi:cell division transport system permease protein